MSRPLVVHVGFHKCGSKLMQRYLAEHPDVHALPTGEALEHLVCAHMPAYDPAPAAAFLGRHMEMARADGHRAVLSAERLSGNPMSGHYDQEAIAGRLKTAGDGPRIILVIREQCAMIASIYRQFVRIGGAATFQRFTQPEWNGRVPEFDHRVYEFDRVVSCYHRMFGRRNVLVVPLERIRDEPDAAFETLCAFMGITFRPLPRERVNVGEADRIVRARRLVNHVCRPRVETIWDRGRPRLRPDGLPARLAVGALVLAGRPWPPVPYERLARERFAGVFRESNRRLAALLDVDLAAWGYEV
jgi:hypothetical protein